MRCSSCNKNSVPFGAKVCPFCGQSIRFVVPPAAIPGGANQDIRRYAAGRGVKLWQIADALGIVDSSFSRKLRNELSQDAKEQVFAIIDELAQAAENE